MNFLQLVQKLRQECGIAGNGPLTVVDQNKESARLVSYINDAWVEIQGLSDTWSFMRKEFGFETVANVGDYTPDGGPGVGAGLSDFRMWHTDTLRCYETAFGIPDEQFLPEWEYKKFRDTYRYAEQTVGRPVVFAVKTNGSALMLGNIPDKSYTIVGEYQCVPTFLVADTDTPAIAAHLHMVIVYKAMEFYGLFEAAPEVLQRGERGFQRFLTMLMREEQDVPTLGDPLA
jgi:hypothetical protein